MSERLRVTIYAVREVKRGERWSPVHVVNKEALSLRDHASLEFERLTHDALHAALDSLNTKAER